MRNFEQSQFQLVVRNMVSVSDRKPSIVCHTELWYDWTVGNQSRRCVPVLYLWLWTTRPHQRGWQTASTSHILRHMSFSHWLVPARPHTLSVGYGSLEWLQTPAGMGQPEGAWLHSVMAGEDVSPSIQPLLGPHGQALSWHSFSLFKIRYPLFKIRWHTLID